MYKYFRSQVTDLFWNSCTSMTLLLLFCYIDIYENVSKASVISLDFSKHSWLFSALVLMEN